jgi:hypothetical protein
VFHHGEALCESPLSECSYEGNGADEHGFEGVVWVDLVIIPRLRPFWERRVPLSELAHLAILHWHQNAFTAIPRDVGRFLRDSHFDCRTLELHESLQEFALEANFAYVDVGIGTHRPFTAAIFALFGAAMASSAAKLCLPLRPLEVTFAMTRVAIRFVIVVVSAVGNFACAIALIAGIKNPFTFTVLARFGPLLKVKVAQGVGFLLAVVGNEISIQLFRKFSNVAVALLRQDIVKVLGGDANGAVCVRRIDEVIVVERGGQVAPVSAEGGEFGQVHWLFEGSEESGRVVSLDKLCVILTRRQRAGNRPVP